MDTTDLQKKVDVMWKKIRKDLDGVWKDTSVLIDKGEKFLKDTSKKGQQELEVVSLSLQREKLYYDLGKLISTGSKSQVTTKKKQALVKKIVGIGDTIKKLKKAIKK